MGSGEVELFLVGVSLIAMAFGDCQALHSAVRSILSRACPSVRCVVMSNYSRSGAVSVVGRCRPLFRNQLG